MHADSNLVQSANIRLLERDSPDHDYRVIRSRRRLWLLRCMEEGATDTNLRSFPLNCSTHDLRCTTARIYDSDTHAPRTLRQDTQQSLVTFFLFARCRHQ
jgi:hypothetical protein